MQKTTRRRKSLVKRILWGLTRLRENRGSNCQDFIIFNSSWDQLADDVCHEALTLLILSLYLQYPECFMTPQPDRSRLVSKVLSSAVGLWLRSQVESVEELHLQIEGGDRQILTGYIPKVMISAHKAVYQGLYMSQVDLTGENIRINLGQVLKGKPLKLLEVIPIQGSLCLEEADLNASLRAPLLANAVTDLVLNWWRSTPQMLSLLQEPMTLQNCQAVMEPNQVTLNLDWQSAAAPISMVLCTGLSLVAGNRLRLEQPKIFTPAQSIQLPDYAVELGTDVALQELRLEAGKITGRGRINVLP
jgi:LmeA-like phospholipid-binding